MKKLIALALTFVLLASLIGCTQNPTQPSEPSSPSEPSQPESISDYLIAEKTNDFAGMLIMPASQKKASIVYPTTLLLEHIDLALLKAAEEKMLAQEAQYEDSIKYPLGFIIAYDTTTGYIYLSGSMGLKPNPNNPSSLEWGFEPKYFRENISDVVPFEDYPKDRE